jgi:proline iminopeptidase
MRAFLPPFLLVLIAACATSRAPSFVDAGQGVRLWYESVGRGTPVVVIHGGPGMDFNSLAPDLVPLTRHHRFIYYDQRGGGRSTLPADTAQLTIDRHVEDLEALRRTLRIEKLTLLAHSFGPAIAARYAIRYPEHVERMVFLGPIPPRKATFFEDYGATLEKRMTPEQRARAEALSESFAKDGIDVIATCRQYWVLGTPPRLAPGRDAAVVKADFCTASAEAIRYGMTKTNATTFGSLGDWDWTADLRGLRIPTLIIHGEEDAIPMALVNEWVSALPDARIIRLPGVAHFPHAEKPDVVFPAIESFLEGRWPSNATR